MKLYKYYCGVIHRWGVDSDMQMGEVLVILVVLAIWAYSIAKFFRSNHITAVYGPSQ